MKEGNNIETQANAWKPFENESLPKANTLVLVYAPDYHPQFVTAKWVGQGRQFLIVVQGSERTLLAEVEQWMEIPPLSEVQNF